MVTTHPTYKYIVLDESGTAFIEGTGYKVRLIVLAGERNAWSPQQLQEQYADLTMAQIYAALAYYYEHEEQMKKDTEEGRSLAGQLRERSPQPTRAELEMRLKEQQQNS